MAKGKLKLDTSNAKVRLGQAEMRLTEQGGRLAAQEAALRILQRELRTPRLEGPAVVEEGAGGEMSTLSDKLNQHDEGCIGLSLPETCDCMRSRATKEIERLTLLNKIRGSELVSARSKYELIQSHLSSSYQREESLEKENEELWEWRQRPWWKRALGVK